MCCGGPGRGGGATPAAAAAAATPGGCWGAIIRGDQQGGPRPAQARLSTVGIPSTVVERRPWAHGGDRAEGRWDCPTRPSTWTPLCCPSTHGCCTGDGDRRRSSHPSSSSSCCYCCCGPLRGARWAAYVERLPGQLLPTPHLATAGGSSTGAAISATCLNISTAAGQGMCPFDASLALGGRLWDPRCGPCCCCLRLQVPCSECYRIPRLIAGS
jgi:hypothetical protein